ncbi:hypothetical protein RRG08_040167 [Elysia crispata]|uniref:Uncharacterized protein n=1 Tax=Elysia crispata TaxID=231223 RepID=A0AAE0XXI6_9GAST|nr:hypothetical protein RRG08_040167 [Elysia crispata]
MSKRRDEGHNKAKKELAEAKNSPKSCGAASKQQIVVEDFWADCRPCYQACSLGRGSFIKPWDELPKTPDRRWIVPFRQ